MWFRKLNVRFWIWLTGMMVFSSVVGLFHEDIDTAEAIVLLLISLPSFLWLRKRLRWLKEYSNSNEYKELVAERRERAAEAYEKRQEELSRRESIRNEREYRENKTKSKTRPYALIGAAAVTYGVGRTIYNLTKRYK